MGARGALPLPLLTLRRHAGARSSSTCSPSCCCGRSARAARTRPARDLSEQEFRSLVDAGSAQGQVDARERRLIHRVFEFSDKNVGQVMTPRDRIFALSYDLPMQRLVKELAARGFSRVPIYQKSLDNVRGIVNAKDLVRAAAGQPPSKPLGEMLHEPLFVPRTTPVKRLFLTFKQKKVHMAIVVSEYGKVLGLVTMDDLLAQIFGVIRDERADAPGVDAGRSRCQRVKPARRRTGPVASKLDAAGAARPIDGRRRRRSTARSGRRRIASRRRTPRAISDVSGVVAAGRGARSAGATGVSDRRGHAAGGRRRRARADAGAQGDDRDLHARRSC